MAVLLAGAGVGGWKAYSLYNEPQKQLEEKQRQLEAVAGQLATARVDLADQRPSRCACSTPR